MSTPRFDFVGPDGTIYVAEAGAGRVIALLDPDRSGHASQSVVVASGLEQPTSLDLYQGALYVGEASRVTRLTLGPTTWRRVGSLSSRTCPLVAITRRVPC